MTTSNIEIKVSIDGAVETAQLICDEKTVSITLVLKNEKKKTYTGSDFYKCFGHVRKDNPNIKFLCKGSKINVHTSSMSSQMSMGLKAYELTLGKTASFSDVIYIFDYDENNLTNNPEEQRDFFMRWIHSEKKDT